MISIKKYLDGRTGMIPEPGAQPDTGILPVSLCAYGGAMQAMGGASLDACPSLGDGLKQSLAELSAKLSPAMSREALQATDKAVQEQVREWGRETARDMRDKAAEVKELLLVMARTAESVGARDQRSAGQLNEVTARLRKIATLDDLSLIRASIEKSAIELKGSIERMTAEGRAAVEELRKEVKVYQAKLEEAEELASRDALTGVRNRMCIEGLLEARARAETPFCVAMLDIDGFKTVNDTHGHLVGDELLKLFAGELRSACRSTDVIGRWGGDEFVVLLDCDLAEAESRIERLERWICGDYTVKTAGSPLKLTIGASIGLAEHRGQEPLKALMARADAAMYERKAAGKSKEASALSPAS